jgi:chorismate dehydratase
MNIAKIPFINTVPYFHLLSKRWLDHHQVLTGNPKQLGELARAGKVDAGLFSLIDAEALVDSGSFEWLGSLGIAGKGTVGSILLCGARDPATLRQQSVGISPQTATTVKLLQVWLEQKVGISNVKFVDFNDACAAQLLIGDDALRRRFERGKTEAQIDLCEAWTEWTQLPFVFARWAVRKEIPLREKKELAITLSAALDLALDDLPHLAQEVADDQALPSATVETYLKGIRYHLSTEDLQGADEFRRRLNHLSSRT